MIEQYLATFYLLGMGITIITIIAYAINYIETYGDTLFNSAVTIFILSQLVITTCIMLKVILTGNLQNMM